METADFLKFRSNMLKDNLGYSNSDMEYLFNVLKRCMAYGVAGAGVGAYAGANAGMITLGTMTIPAVVVGALAGYVGGTASCAIGLGSLKGHLDEIVRIRP
ncbi:hypothetical protein OVA24_13320 [Luteolibacter sp. SL250]|uniref:hypothetical protein n=1 Tax=Luteolibacter sp. SL250 TaxID=2995170 RepID=UPI0022721175|nr:hypothetical protein [Luteolibacter sp. SL250]WAC18218.1 hypothetical protein OVA24_13320 [Luteolibacter sp. SL250]